MLETQIMPKIVRVYMEDDEGNVSTASVAKFKLDTLHKIFKDKCNVSNSVDCDNLETDITQTLNMLFSEDLECPYDCGDILVRAISKTIFDPSSPSTRYQLDVILESLNNDKGICIGSGVDSAAFGRSINQARQAYHPNHSDDEVQWGNWGK